MRQTQQDLWLDPDPNAAPGILLSDRIRFYVERVKLIDPFEEAALRPASYTLHVGSEYLMSQTGGKLVEGDLQRDGKVVIPPNGLIYVRFLERINLPYYLIARFNLRVKQVYRGLLLGTGPQVDPGFEGHLGCPIHNFTDEDKTLHFREPIATIDFEKTTPLGHVAADEDERRATVGNATALPGLNGYPCILFEETRDRRLREYLPPAESIRSSVLALQAEMDSVRREWTIYRRLAAIAGLGVALGVAALILTAAGMTFDAYRELKSDLARMGETIAQIQARRDSEPMARQPDGRSGPPETAAPKGVRGKVDDAQGKK